MPKRKATRAFSDEGATLTKATIRASDKLGISQKVLASVIGLSESTISRMRRGSFALERDKGKGFELAQLLLQLYDSLDPMVHGDAMAAKAWLVAENSALRGRPVDLIQRAQGLADVVNYLRARLSI
jgi:transcriptional regulator with XRE-family HTH domain